MKKSNRLGRVFAGAMLSLAMVGLPASVWARNSTESAPSNAKTERRQEIKAMREKMLAESKANDAELQKMIAELNQAPEAKKTDLQSAILTKMVEQQHQMLNNWENLRTHLKELRQERTPTGRNAPETQK